MEVTIYHKTFSRFVKACEEKLKTILPFRNVNENIVEIYKMRNSKYIVMKQPPLLLFGFACDAPLRVL